MKRKVFQWFKNNSSVQFAIRQEHFANGKVKYSPVIKQPGFMQQWTGIVKEHDKYYALDLNTDHWFTEEECNSYIDGFKAQIAKANEKKLVNIKYQEV